MGFDPLLFIIYGLPLLLAIPMHEAAHGFVADRCGDPTAKRLGRVTFNPIKHVDPFGTLALPALLIVSGAPFVFGWAKPVPVDFANLRNLRRDMILVAGAGPAINLLLALLSAVALRYAASDLSFADGEALPWWVEMLVFSVMLNVALAVFNLLPILPLDGGRILTGLLPPRLAIPFSRTERYGMALLLLFLLLPPLVGMMLGKDWNLFAMLLVPPIFAVMDFMLALVGMA